MQTLSVGANGVSKLTDLTDSVSVYIYGTLQYPYTLLTISMGHIELNIELNSPRVIKYVMYNLYMTSASRLRSNQDV